MKKYVHFVLFFKFKHLYALIIKSFSFSDLHDQSAKKTLKTRENV